MNSIAETKKIFEQLINKTINQFYIKGGSFGFMPNQLFVESFLGIKFHPFHLDINIDWKVEDDIDVNLTWRSSVNFVEKIDTVSMSNLKTDTGFFKIDINGFYVQNIRVYKLFSKDYASAMVEDELDLSNNSKHKFYFEHCIYILSNKGEKFFHLSLR